MKIWMKRVLLALLLIGIAIGLVGHVLDGTARSLSGRMEEGLTIAVSAFLGVLGILIMLVEIIAFVADSKLATSISAGFDKVINWFNRDGLK